MGENSAIINVFIQLVPQRLKSMFLKSLIFLKKEFLKTLILTFEANSATYTITQNTYRYKDILCNFGEMVDIKNEIRTIIL